MKELLKELELFQLTRDNRNKNIAKAIIFNNIMLAKQDNKLTKHVRKLHNKYASKLTLKPYDYYVELETDTILKRMGL